MTKKRIRERRIHWQDKWKLANGCMVCGYDKHPRALSFDHMNREDKHILTKNGKASTNGGGMWQLTNADIPLRVMVDEWRKCRILCMNCHMEKRYPKKVEKK